MRARTLHGGPRRHLVPVVPLNVIEAPAPKQHRGVWVLAGVFIGFVAGFLAGAS